MCVSFEKKVLILSFVRLNKLNKNIFEICIGIFNYINFMYVVRFLFLIYLFKRFFCFEGGLVVMIFLFVVCILKFCR